MTILGSGTSTGVPVIACPCATCTSSDPYDHRTRASLMITLPDGHRLVIDTGPDFRMQMLRHGVAQLEHVLFTHDHADHCHGFDDLRAFYFRGHRPVTCYVAERHVAAFRRRFDYVFTETGYIGTKPQVLMQPFAEAPFTVLGLTVEPFYAQHGNMQTAVFRIGRFAYATDFKVFSPELKDAWRGTIDTMVASGIRYGEHPTHSCIQETLALFRDLQVRRGYITHISHEVMHARDSLKLPESVQLGYDGLSFTALVGTP